MSQAQTAPQNPPQPEKSASNEPRKWLDGRKFRYWQLRREQALHRSRNVSDIIDMRTVDLDRLNRDHQITYDVRTKIVDKYKSITKHSVNVCQRRPLPSFRKLPNGDVIETGRNKNANLRIYRDDVYGLIERSYWDLRSCDNGLFCVWCSNSVMRHMRDELEEGLSNWEEHHQYGVMMFITYTYPHYRDKILAVNMDRVGEVLSMFHEVKSYTNFKNTYGMDGYIRASEATYGQSHGWHQHYHECDLFDGWRIVRDKIDSMDDVYNRVINFLNKNQLINDQLISLLIDLRQNATRYLRAAEISVREQDRDFTRISDEEIISYLCGLDASSLDNNFLFRCRPIYNNWQGKELAKNLNQVRSAFYIALYLVMSLEISNDKRLTKRYRKWFRKFRNSVRDCLHSMRYNIIRKLKILHNEKEVIDKEIKENRELIVEGIRGDEGSRIKINTVALMDESERLKQEIDVIEDGIKSFLIDRWIHCCVSKGLVYDDKNKSLKDKIEDMKTRSVDINYGVTRKQWRYLIKTMPWELTNPSNTKESKSAGRMSQWDVLRRATDRRVCYAKREEYIVAWIDYVAAMIGRPAVYWSPGLRERCGLTEEKTEEGSIYKEYSENMYRKIDDYYLHTPTTTITEKHNGFSNGLDKIYTKHGILEWEDEVLHMLKMQWYEVEVLTDDGHNRVKRAISEEIKRIRESIVGNDSCSAIEFTLADIIDFINYERKMLYDKTVGNYSGSPIQVTLGDIINEMVEKRIHGSNTNASAC